MHLSHASAATRIAAAAGFFFLAVLLGLSLGDYLTRPG
jgi:caa(3)-type oxidase subunit IV